MRQHKTKNGASEAYCFNLNEGMGQSLDRLCAILLAFQCDDLSFVTNSMLCIRLIPGFLASGENGVCPREWELADASPHVMKIVKRCK